VIFCVLIRWQPCNSRFHLPFFLLMAPLLGAVIGTRLSAALQIPIVAIVIFFGLYILAKNQSCPLFVREFRAMPREQQALLRKQELYQPMVLAASEIVVSGCRKVGVKMGYDGFEYPFLNMLFNRGYAGRVYPAFSEEQSTSIFRNFKYERERQDVRLHDASGLVYCSPKDVDVLVTTSSVLSPEITKRLPHETKLGPLTLYWTKAAFKSLEQNLHEKSTGSEK
jgi:hypothetical protein